MQGRGRARRELCQHTAGRGRRRQICHVQLAGATLAYDGEVSSWPAGKGESYREDGGAEGVQVPSDKEAGRQNKLQSLPLTRIAGRDSPQAPLHSGFIRPQTGKIAAQDQPTNQNQPPGLARECLGSACSCLTSQPLLPAPGRFAEQIRTIAQPPARYGVIPSAPLRACESGRAVVA